MEQESQEGGQVPDLLQLTCLDGPCEGSEFAKLATVLTIGRTTRSKICIKDPSISEKHAKIEWDGQAWMLQDLGSSNGTKVNGTYLKEEDEAIALRDQDLLHFGDSKLRVQVTPVPAESVTVEQYLRAESSRYEQRAQVKLAQLANQLMEEWKIAKQGLIEEAVSQR